jgi:ankyrin repeat protein
MNNNIKLIDAVTDGNIDFVKRSIDLGADIHYLDDFALRLASKHGHLEIVKYFVENNADIHCFNDVTLKIASINSHPDLIRYLIQQGSNIFEEMDVPEDVQETSINSDIGNIKYIINLRADLKEKYKHLLQASGFGFFEDD